MKRPTTDPALSAVERNASHALLLADPQRTRECPDIEALLDASEQVDATGSDPPAMDHVARCPYCRRQYAALRAAFTEADTLREAAIDDRTSSRTGFRQIAGNWLLLLSSTISIAREPLRAPLPALGFSTHTHLSDRQPLEFDDPDASGTYRVEGRKREIHIEHRRWPVGSLVLLEVPGLSGEVAWRGFAVLRQGFRRAVADLTADTADVERGLLHVGMVSPAGLTADMIATLERSYAAVLTQGALPAEDWQSWAARALQDPVEPAVREALKRIAGHEGG